MYKVYVLKSASTNKVYIGHTSDLQKRLKQHQTGNSLSTRNSHDWKLAYSEDCNSVSLAIKREKYFKSGDGRRVLCLKGIL